MRSVLILVLTSAFYASVNCGDSSGFDDELLTTDIKQIFNRKVVQNILEQSNHQIETLETQLQSQNANLENLQRQVFLLSEANERNENQIEELKTEIEQLKSNQTPHQTSSNEVNQTSKSSSSRVLDSSEELSQEKVESDLQWIPWSLNEPIPQNTVKAGYDLNNAPIYVGRSYINGNHIITKVVPDRPAAYYSFEGSEYRVHNCEILTGSGFSWVVTSNGNLPQNAVSSGKWVNDVPHFIGRVNHNSIVHWTKSLVPGTIQGESGILYIPFGGRELQYTEYEVMVYNQTNLEQNASI